MSHLHLPTRFVQQHRAKKQRRELERALRDAPTTATRQEILAAATRM